MSFIEHQWLFISIIIPNQHMYVYTYHKHTGKCQECLSVVSKSMCSCSAIFLQYPQSQLMPPSPLQLVPSLLASPTPSPAQPLSLGERHCPLSPPFNGLIPVGVLHQRLVPLLTSHWTHFECLMLGSTPAMSVYPHHSSLELGTLLIHLLLMCRVSTIRRLFM